MKNPLLFSKILIVFLTIFLHGCVNAQNATLPKGVSQATIVVKGVSRTYFIKRPAKNGNEKFPLVISLHGGGGKASDAIDGSDPNGTITIAPQAINKSWNVGGMDNKSKADDLGLLNALIDYAIKNENADPQRVRLIGISRGGMMAFYALSELNDKIQGAIIGIASIPDVIRPKFKLPKPVHIMIVNGTEDPLIPYNGGWGSIGKPAKTGTPKTKMHPTETVTHDIAIMQGLNTTPVITQFPDKDPNDGCTAEQYSWKGNKNQGSVTLIKIIGGGHTIPGVPQVFPESWVGKTCRDIDIIKIGQDFWDNMPVSR
jgi:polyhydroxybutyrate depolymerase